MGATNTHRRSRPASAGGLATVIRWGDTMTILPVNAEALLPLVVRAATTRRGVSSVRAARSSSLFRVGHVRRITAALMFPSEKGGGPSRGS